MLNDLKSSAEAMWVCKLMGYSISIKSPFASPRWDIPTEFKCKCNTEKFIKGIHRDFQADRKHVSNFFSDNVLTVIDGWTKNNTHYIGEFSTFPCKNGITIPKIRFCQFISPFLPFWRNKANSFASKRYDWVRSFSRQQDVGQRNWNLQI